MAKPLSTTEQARQARFPDQLRVLVIGESPPAGGRFFYLADSGLYQATWRAFAQAVPAVRRTDDFLAVFEAMGCYSMICASTPSTTW